MTDGELMQQALDAMLNFPNDISDEMFESIKALRARLAQPEQEPVAWVENLENARPHCVIDLKYCSVAQHERGEHLKYIPLYTAPPQREWQGLTDEEQMQVAWSCGAMSADWLDFARAIEAKLKEKNNG